MLGFIWNQIVSGIRTIEAFKNGHFLSVNDFDLRSVLPINPGDMRNTIGPGEQQLTPNFNSPTNMQPNSIMPGNSLQPTQIDSSGFPGAQNPNPIHFPNSQGQSDGKGDSFPNPIHFPNSQSQPDGQGNGFPNLMHFPNSPDQIDGPRKVENRLPRGKPIYTDQNFGSRPLMPRNPNFLPENLRNEIYPENQPGSNHNPQQMVVPVLKRPIKKHYSKMPISPRQNVLPRQDILPNQWPNSAILPNNNRLGRTMPDQLRPDTNFDSTQMQEPGFSPSQNIDQVEHPVGYMSAPLLPLSPMPLPSQILSQNVLPDPERGWMSPTQPNIFPRMPKVKGTKRNKGNVHHGHLSHDKLLFNMRHITL